MDELDEANGDQGGATAYCNAPARLAALRNFLGNGNAVYFEAQGRTVYELCKRKKHVFLVAETGGGKTGTFQLPTVAPKAFGFKEEKITIVVNPVRNISKDQLDDTLAGLARMREPRWGERDPPAAVMPDSAVQVLGAELSGDQVHSILNKCLLPDTDGNRVRMLIVCPETWERPEFQRVVFGVSGRHFQHDQRRSMKDICSRFQAKLRFIVIDEVHCASWWSLDHRKAYRTVTTQAGKLARTPKLDLRLLLLSATAPRLTREHVVSLLGLQSDELEIIKGPLHRPNLYQEFRSTTSIHEVIDVLNEHLVEGGRRAALSGGCAIVYTQTRAEAVKLFKHLQNRVHEVSDSDDQSLDLAGQGTPKISLDTIGCSHGCLSREHNDDVVSKYKEGKLRIIVATTSFGMGINGDTTLVINYLGSDPLSSARFFFTHN